MRSYEVIVAREALTDLRGMAQYVASIYRPESGHNFVDRILGKLDSLSYCADVFPYSLKKSVKRIHPQAKTMLIIHRRWTVVFHTEEDFVIIDRILPSKTMAY